MSLLGSDFDVPEVLTMISDTELRDSGRRSIDAKTEVRLGNGIIVEGQAKDISLHGLMFHTDQRLPMGKPVRIIIILDSEPETCRISAGGFVARLHDEGVAVRFTEIDPDGMQYLREEVLRDVTPRRGTSVPTIHREGLRHAM